MKHIYITLPEGEIPVTGKQVTFKAPCNSDLITIIHIENTDLRYALYHIDGCMPTEDTFKKGAVVTVVLDNEELKAYLQSGGLYETLEAHTYSKTLLDAKFDLKLDSKALPEALNLALTQAKTSGEFDGVGVARMYIAEDENSTYNNFLVIEYTDGTRQKLDFEALTDREKDDIIQGLISQLPNEITGSANMTYKGAVNSTDLDSITNKKVGDSYYVVDLHQFHFWNGVEMLPILSNVVDEVMEGSSVPVTSGAVYEHTGRFPLHYWNSEVLQRNIYEGDLPTKSGATMWLLHHGMYMWEADTSRMDYLGNPVYDENGEQPKGSWVKLGPYARQEIPEESTAGTVTGTLPVSVSAVHNFVTSMLEGKMTFKGEIALSNLGVTTENKFGNVYRIKEDKSYWIHDGVEWAPLISKYGEGGFSPTANVVQTDSGATITITDKDGTTTATLTNGKDGQDGQDGYTPQKGVDYFDGKDGVDGVDGKDYVLTDGDKLQIADICKTLIADGNEVKY